MEVETGLVPPSIRLNTAIRQSAFRTFKLLQNHPIPLALASTTNYDSVLSASTSTRASPKPTQLERISNSISRFTQGADFETLLHYYFAPWDKTTPYKVNILLLSKDKAAKAHNRALNQF